MLGLQRRRTKPPHAAPPQDFPCDDPVLALVRGGPDAAHRIDGGPPFQSEHKGATEPTCVRRVNRWTIQSYLQKDKLSEVG